MIPLGTWPRFLSALVCLLVTAMALNLRSAREAVVPQTNLAYFPHTINGWNGSDLGLSSDEVATLGPGQFLLRDYDRPNTPTVTLFLAYYPSQQPVNTLSLFIVNAWFRLLNRFVEADDVANQCSLMTPRLASLRITRLGKACQLASLIGANSGSLKRFGRYGASILGGIRHEREGCIGCPFSVLFLPMQFGEWNASL